MTRSKSKRVQDLAEKLDLQGRGWILVDHWEADAFAIGLARADDPRRLVYVDANSANGVSYFFECEVPTGAEPTSFEVVKRGEVASLDELVLVIKEHLDGSRQPRRPDWG